MCEIMERLNAEAREEGREEGREQGREEGREEGRGEGISDVNTLNLRLIAENRLDDLRRAATDAAYQSQLLRELLPQRAR